MYFMKNCIYKLSLFLPLFLAGLVGTAQTTVSGTLIDADTKEGLIGANIVVAGTSTGTITDIDGSFTLNVDKTAPFDIELSYTGYEAQTVSVSGSGDIGTISMSPTSSMLDEVVISASRKREKVQEAPASVSVLTAKKLATSPHATDPVRNLANLAGVQIAQSSASRINISMRGGSGLFGTSVFPIIDYRSLVGPGIGTFQSDQAGISQLDLERIEVVRGPGSALYGPGVTQGVVHFISKSPIDHPGTAVELIGGELSTLGVTARHATKVSDKFGFKINAFYKQGDEFTLDPNDPADSLQIAKFTTTGVYQPAVKDGIVDANGTPVQLLTPEELDPDGDGNPIQNDWFSTALNATLEFRPSDDLNLTFAGGYNAASAVFHNEQGEGLAQNNEFWGQGRMQLGGLFAQVFYVDNDGGTEKNPTFLYQTGNRTPVGRTQLEAQVQYNFDTPDFLNGNWTAGFDYRFAGQDTENLVYGRNEDDDDFSIVGGYVQGKFALASKLDLVVAGRYDQFNFIDEGAFAPRAAFVYKASPKHTFRASFNRANSSVSNLQLNIDFPLSTITETFDVWLYGNKTPQTFNNGQTAWLIPVPTGLDNLPLGVAYGAVHGDVLAGVVAALGADPTTAPLIPAVTGALNAIDPATLGFFSGPLSPGFNIFDGTPLGLVDAPISKIATDDNFEIGYKGLIADKLGVSVDIYHVTQKNNSQFTAISPAYRLTNLDALGGELGAAVSAAAGPTFIALLAGSGIPQEQAEAIWGVLGPQIEGGYTLGGQGFAAVIGGLPFHATTPTDQVPDNGVTHLAAGYRTFDERSWFGADIGLEYYFNNDLTTFFNYSWVSDNEFMQNVVGLEGVSLPSYLNNPKSKFRMGLNYNPEEGFNGSLAFQHDDSYYSASGQFAGDTGDRDLWDAAIGYGFGNGLTVGVAATNVLNKEYRYLPNMPKIGRRTLAKITYVFQ